MMAVTYCGTLYSDGFASELSLFVDFFAKHQMTISLKRNPSKSIDFTKVIFARPCSCDGSRKKTSAFFSCYSYVAVVRRFYRIYKSFSRLEPSKIHAKQNTPSLLSPLILSNFENDDFLVELVAKWWVGLKISHLPGFGLLFMSSWEAFRNLARDNTTGVEGSLCPSFACLQCSLPLGQMESLEMNNWQL